MSPMLLWETANICFLKHLINVGTHKWRMKIQKLIGFLTIFSKLFITVEHKFLFKKNSL